MNKKLLSLILAMVVFSLAACGRQGRISSSEPICLQGMSRADVVQIAEEMLVDMRFVIEKSDIDDGVVQTRPLRGAQVFEFWRSDSAGGINTAESNIHSLRRTVRLDVFDSEGRTCVKCGVGVQRLSIPEKEIASMSQAAGLFSRGDSSLQKLTINKEQKAAMEWIDLGTDAALETKILGRLEEKVNESK